MNSSRITEWKTILKIAWPLVVANSFWNLQLTIDRLFLGNYSTEALGAVIAVAGVFWTPMALLQQTSAYVTTFIAQYFGAKQNEMVGPAFWHSLYISIAGGVIILLLVFLSDSIFAWIGHAPSTRKLESEYFIAICFSALPTAIVAAVCGFFTGLGSTGVIIGINSVGLIANVFFDYLLIFGNMGFPAMGVSGAGYATALANLFAAIYGLYLVFNKTNEKKYQIFSGWKPNKEMIKRYLRFGLPSGMQWALEGLAFSAFLIIIGQMQNGDAVLSASGIVVTIMLLSVLPALGVAQSVSVLVGQHLGEKNPRLAGISVWSGLQVALIYIIPVGLSFILFPRFYLNWFYNPDTPEIWKQVSYIVPYLLIFVGLFTAFDCMNLVFSFALKGAGDTKFVTLVALLLPWPLMVIPTWIFKDNADSVYLAWGAASIYIVAQAFIFWRRFAGGKWKKMSVIQ